MNKHRLKIAFGSGHIWSRQLAVAQDVAQMLVHSSVCLGRNVPELMRNLRTCARPNIVVMNIHGPGMHNYLRRHGFITVQVINDRKQMEDTYDYYVVAAINASADDNRRYALDLLRRIARDQHGLVDYGLIDSCVFGRFE